MDAADVYEIVVSDTAGPTSWWHDLLRRARRGGPADAGGVLIRWGTKKPVLNSSAISKTEATTRTTCCAASSTILLR